jgi:exonuclease SbcC
VKLLRLQAGNFCCFERLDLDLNVDGLVAVVGDNGAGKSTLFAAVEWGLYGVQRGRSAMPVRRDSCEEDASCWVEVHFEVGGRAYGVRRVDRKEAELFHLDTEEKICDGRDETSRQVAVLLGLTRDMFRGTFYARQREVHALDSDNEVKRREQVELLLGIERLRLATAHAQAAAKEQKHVVDALDVDAPNIDALQNEVGRLAREDEQDRAVEQASEHLKKAKEARERAKTKLEGLRAQERNLIERRSRVEAAAAEVEQERSALKALDEQVADGEAAKKQLGELEPAAGRLEALTAAEREMDLMRASHERVGHLRDRQHQALAVAASLADQLDELDSTLEGPSPDDDRDLPKQVEAVEEEIETTRLSLGSVSEDQEAAERRAQVARDRIALGERAAELDERLNELQAAERAVEDALSQWHALTAKRTQLHEAIKHDTEHRDAIAAGEQQAACPTCRRSYDEGELEVILASHERDLEAATQELAELDQELATRKGTDGQLSKRVEQLRALAADRRAISDPPDAEELPALREQMQADIAKGEGLAGEKHRHEARLNTLTALLPRLRQRAREAAEHQKDIAALEAKRKQAERDAQLFAEELRNMSVNGYAPDAHERLRSELAQAQAASQRCAALRGKANGLDLVLRRLDVQRATTAAAEKRHTEMEATLADIAVDPEGLRAAQDACDVAERDVDTAHEALAEASRRATLSSEALTAANARLRDARERTAHIREQRVELRMRSQVALALSTFREDASRRTRPTLEHETGLLLGLTTRQRYNDVRLTDSYQLEVIDDGQSHPLRRFSGGEQDLAGLCLRLALSRTLAHQRGAETGFVLLDEVFGSQDHDRRRALLEQLHAIADSEFRQVFVISHTADVVEHCDLTIDVRRDEDGKSVAFGPHR